MLPPPLLPPSSQQPPSPLPQDSVHRCRRPDPRALPHAPPPNNVLIVASPLAVACPPPPPAAVTMSPQQRHPTTPRHARLPAPPPRGRCVPDNAAGTRHAQSHRRPPFPSSTPPTTPPRERCDAPTFASAIGYVTYSFRFEEIGVLGWAGGEGGVGFFGP